MADCVFCKIAAGQIKSRIVYETEDVIAFIDLNPQAPTHFIIIPIKHIAKLSAATSADLELLGKIQLAAVELAKQFNIKDFRLVSNNGRGAGQSVDHLHYHLLAGRRMNWPPG